MCLEKLTNRRISAVVLHSNFVDKHKHSHKYLYSVTVHVAITHFKKQTHALYFKITLFKTQSLL
jgi:hypothetical protein